MDADPEPHAEPGSRIVVVHRPGDGDRQIRHPLEMIRAPDRHASDDHVGVADGLDLLEVARVDEGVEHAEYLVEEPDELLGIHRGRHRGEPDDIGEEQRHVVVAIGDQPFTGSDPIGDGLREDVEQQLEVLLVGHLQLALGGHVRAIDVRELEFRDVDGEEFEVTTGTVHVDRPPLSFAGGETEVLGPGLRERCTERPPESGDQLVRRRIYIDEDPVHRDAEDGVRVLVGEFGRSRAAP